MINGTQRGLKYVSIHEKSSHSNHAFSCGKGSKLTAENTKLAIFANFMKELVD
jgi:hypothetical protein